MSDYREAFVGIDVAKLRNAIAIADAGREGEVRFFGEVDASDTSMRRVVQRIAAKFHRVYFCYEAGPTGYGLYRLIRSLGHECSHRGSRRPILQPAAVSGRVAPQFMGDCQGGATERRPISCIEWPYTMRSAISRAPSMTGIARRAASPRI